MLRLFRSGDTRSCSFFHCVLPWSGFLFRPLGCSPAEAQSLRLFAAVPAAFVWLCLMVSGHSSTQTCSNSLTGLHVWRSVFLLDSCVPPVLVLSPAASTSSAASGRCSRMSFLRGLVEGFLLLETPSCSCRFTAILAP